MDSYVATYNNAQISPQWNPSMYLKDDAYSTIVDHMQMLPSCRDLIITICTSYCFKTLQSQPLQLSCSVRSPFLSAGTKNHHTTH